MNLILGTVWYVLEYLFILIHQDFGDEILIEPTTYTLRYTSQGSACCPRNWILQGSNEPPTAVSYILSVIFIY